MKRHIVFLLMFVLMSSCAAHAKNAVSWMQTGPSFSGKTANIEVFFEENEITQPFGYFGRINTNFNDISDSAIKAIKKEAVKNGADAVLVHKTNTAVTGYAIKYTENLTEEDRQAIRNFVAQNTWRD